MPDPLDLLTEAAQTRPTAVALLSPERSWNFAGLARAVSHLAGRLDEAGVRPRSSVGLDLPAAAEWITTLALMRLAARSVSLVGLAGAVPVTLDHMVTTADRAARWQLAPQTRIHRATAEWFDAPDGDGAPGNTPRIRYPRPDSVFRYVLTSGTTGMPKAARFTLGTIEHRMAHLDAYWTDDRREIDLMPLSTTGGLHTALATLRHGNPYLAIDRIDPASMRLAAAQRIAVLAGSPVQVGAALRVMRENGIAIPSLEEVRLAGAAPSATLLQAIATELAVPVAVVYGSTEAGGVTRRIMTAADDARELGAVLPGVEVRVVDEAGETVTAGGSGWIEVRGPGVVDGYDTPTGVELFSRGWFRSGDRGSLHPENGLVLDGREGEIVNLGGVKVDPATIDAEVEGFAGVIDAGAFVLERTPGVPELGLAVVAAEGADLRALDQHLRRRLPGRHPTVFGQVAVIPRNRMGKVERQRLTAEFRRRLGLG